MYSLLRRITFLLIVGLFVGSAVPAAAQVFVYPRRPGQTNVRWDEFEWRHINLFTGSDREVQTSDPGPRGGADPVSSHLPREDREMLPLYPLHHPGGQSPTLHSSFLTSDGAEADSAAAVKSTDSTSSNDSPDESKSRYEKALARAGGLKLYYYESARKIAERAVVVVGESYRDLIDAFDFGPPKTFPFILYNTYQEFLQTNLFPIQEGVLGVTSPRDLKLTLPYFGDHRQFRRVAHHELVHEFTIQKVRTFAGRHDTFRDPLEGLPLWFIEGLAEYYTHDGMDDETEMLIRDLAVHEDGRRGYVLPDFFQRGPRSYLTIYKLGQARCTFLEETYGSGTLQTILERSYKLGLGRWQKNRLTSFESLVENVTGDKPKNVAAKFEQWVKNRAYESYLESSQKHGDFPQLDKIDRYIRGLDAADDGNVLLYKTVDRNTGQNRLFLADRRDLKSETRLVADGHPKVTSLHPLEPDNFDLNSEEVVFVAQSRGRDVVYRQSYSAEANKKKNKANDDSSNNDYRARIKTGSRTGYRLGPKGVVAAESPVLAPDGERIAFIGLDEDGQKDIFILTPRGDDFELTRVTDDIYAERGLDWSEKGLVFASDETGHGRYNLFRVPPQPEAESTRLTSAPNDHFEPEVLEDGRIVFVAYDDAKADLHMVDEDGVVRKTDVTTGLFNPSPGPSGGIWALFHHSGRRVPVQITSNKLGEFDERSSAPDVAAGTFESRSLEGSRDYQPLALKNWELNHGFGILGITSSGIFGQLFASASDRLRNHRLLLDFVAFGSFDLTDGALTYINQQNRIVWGASAFQDFRYRIDETFEDEPPFLSFERFYGGRGLVRYPFNQFAYLQFALGAGGTTYFLPETSKARLQEDSPAGAPSEREQRWRQLNDSPRLQTEGEVSFGFDSIQYQRQTGPLRGSSLLLSLTGDYQPEYDVTFGSARLDGESYLPLYDRINLFLRLGAGTSFGDRLARQFFLSSFYTLRGVPFRDPSFLLGRNFGYSTLELQFPLNFLVRIPFIDIEGIAGADFGGVGGDFEGMWRRRVLDAAFGVNFGFGPLVFRLHFAKPFDIGAERVPNNGRWVPNLSLGWRYL